MPCSRCRPPRTSFLANNSRYSAVGCRVSAAAKQCLVLLADAWLALVQVGLAGLRASLRPHAA